MNLSHVYVPVIKGKLNDIKALRELFDDTRGLVKPLIEAMPVNRKKSTIDKHLHKFIDYIIKYYPSGNIYVDFHGFMPDDTLEDETNATIAGFNLLKAHGRVVTPVYGFERNDTLWPRFKEIVASFDQGFCFRVSMDDLDDRAEETWTQIIERSADLGLTPRNVDIVIDLRYIGDKNENELKEVVVDFLALNSNASMYRSIVIAGSSALKTVSDIEKEGVSEVFRSELKLWSALRRDVDGSLRLIFGDYGVVHPDFSDRGNSKYTNAKIRYTVGSHIIYFRGHGLHYPTKDYEQYHSLATKVYEDKRYKGSAASFGDNYLSQCAQRAIRHGSPSTWVLADMNHHVSYTALQIQRLVVTFSREHTEKEATQAMETI